MNTPYILTLFRNFFCSRLWFGFFAFCVSLTLWAANPFPCDPDLKPDEQNPNGYRLRQERCEGTYVQEVAGTTLFVGSLTAGFEEYDLAFNKDLQLQWRQPGNAEVHLRAYGLRRRLYYRMDAIRPPGNEPFKWSMAILGALQIQNRDLGIIGWHRQTIGNVDRDVYLPIRVTQRNAANPTNTYALVLQPGVEFKEVYVSVANVNSEGKPTNYLRDSQPLKYGYYPADRRIDVPLELQTPGLYLVEIGGELKNGGTTTLEFLMYHSDQ